MRVVKVKIRSSSQREIQMGDLTFDAKYKTFELDRFTEDEKSVIASLIQRNVLETDSRAIFCPPIAQSAEPIQVQDIVVYESKPIKVQLTFENGILTVTNVLSGPDTLSVTYDAVNHQIVITGVYKAPLAYATALVGTESGWSMKTPDGLPQMFSLTQSPDFSTITFNKTQMISVGAVSTTGLILNIGY